MLPVTSSQQAKVKIIIHYTHFDGDPTGTICTETVHSKKGLHPKYMWNQARDYLLDKYKYQFMVVDKIQHAKVTQ